MVLNDGEISFTNPLLFLIIQVYVNILVLELINIQLPPALSLFLSFVRGNRRGRHMLCYVIFVDIPPPSWPRFITWHKNVDTKHRVQTPWH